MNNSLKPLSPEKSKEYLAKAIKVRKDRAAELDKLKEGKLSISDFINRSQAPLYGKVKVRSALLRMPGIGPAKAAKILESCKISEKKRFSGLGYKQKQSLKECFPA